MSSNHAVQFTLESRNSKTGPIPVTTTSEDSCPPSCPLKDMGCYAKQGPLGAMWRALSSTVAGDTFKNGRGNVQTFTWSQLCTKIAELPIGTLWRHNQAGDLPGQGDRIDRWSLNALVKANSGKRGFTYTHKPLNSTNAAAAIAAANERGFTVNLSADNLAEADQLADAAIGPVVVVLPDTIQGNAEIHTPAGRRVVVCPATYRDDTSCSKLSQAKGCELCQRANLANHCRLSCPWCRQAQSIRYRNNLKLQTIGATNMSRNIPTVKTWKVTFIERANEGNTDTFYTVSPTKLFALWNGRDWHHGCHIADPDYRETVGAHPQAATLIQTGAQMPQLPHHRSYENGQAFE